MVLVHPLLHHLVAKILNHLLSDLIVVLMNLFDSLFAVKALIKCYLKFVVTFFLLSQIDHHSIFLDLPLLFVDAAIGLLNYRTDLIPALISVAIFKYFVNICQLQKSTAFHILLL